MQDILENIRYLGIDDIFTQDELMLYQQILDERKAVVEKRESTLNHIKYDIIPFDQVFAIVCSPSVGKYRNTLFQSKLSSKESLEKLHKEIYENKAVKEVWPDIRVAYQSFIRNQKLILDRCKEVTDQTYFKANFPETGVYTIEEVETPYFYETFEIASSVRDKIIKLKFKN